MFEIKKLEDFESVCEKYRKIMLYGAGGVGRQLYTYCMDIPIRISAFIQTIPTTERVEGIRVLSLNQLTMQEKEESLIVVSVKKPLVEEILQVIRTEGIKEVALLSEEFIEELEQWLEERLRYRNQMIHPVLDGVVLEGKRILIVSPHPDDEVIGCGGLLALYGKNTDILCINSAGVKYEWNEDCAEEIALERVEEFYAVSRMIGAKKSHIEHIWGTPPMYTRIEKHLQDYRNCFDYGVYDYIFLPNLFDGHREHQYVSNWLFPQIVKGMKLKENLQIAFYEVWAVINAPNFYLDISEVIDEKRNYINAYRSRIKGDYARYIAALNEYRGQMGGCRYAEAYQIVPFQSYLEMPKSNEWRE